jgi:hypothetical protein
MRSLLQAHEMNKHGVNPIGSADSWSKPSSFLQCSSCPKVFRAQSLLEIHSRKHTGDLDLLA